MWGENMKNCECSVVQHFPREKFHPHMEIQYGIILPPSIFDRL